MNYVELDGRDAAMYFNNTLCVNKSDGKAYKVSVDGGPVYKIFNSTRPRNQVATLSPKEFFRDFLPARVALGWVNTTSGAMYLVVRTDRSTKKGFSEDRINSFCPYHNGVVRMLDNAQHADYTANREDYSPATIKIREAVDNLDREAALARRLEFAGSVLNPQYLSFADASEALLSDPPSRWGAALSMNFGAMYCHSGADVEVGMFYRKSRIGKLSTMSGRIVLNKEAAELHPQIMRELAVPKTKVIIR